jgi:hypothetical protein
VAVGALGTGRARILCFYFSKTVFNELKGTIIMLY